MQPFKIFRASSILCATFAILALQGCLPSRVMLDLDPEPGKLHEQTLTTGDTSRGASPKIALIRVDGFIANTPMPSTFGMSPNPTDELVRRLDRAAKDPKVRAVVLVVNSPGGTITGAETMYNEIMRFRERSHKPVVVSMGEIATSGGYYISLAGDHIYANPTTLTASIGVLMQMVNISKGLNMIGVNARAITSGPNKSMGSPLEPIVPEHYNILQGITDEFFSRFVDKVTSRRAAYDHQKNPWATDGRVVSGTTALSIGLIDELGGVREAFAKAKELAAVDSARLVRYTPSKLKSSASPFVGQAALQQSRQPLVQTSSSVIGGLKGLEVLSLPPGFYYLWMPGVN
jgi:protease IV